MVHAPIIPDETDTAMTYTPPMVEDLGSLADLTQGGTNKVGWQSDMYSATTPLTGSMLPAK